MFSPISLVTCLIVVSVLCSTATSSSICNIAMEGSCVCLDPTEEVDVAREVLPRLQGLKKGLRVECHSMTGHGLHQSIDAIVKYFNGNRSIWELEIHDSNLANMRGLPSGLVDLKDLTLDNTNIDLEQIRESSENLGSLKTFKVFRENFTETPEDFFRDLNALVNLGLNNVGLKGISPDGLEFLEDSLKVLSLRDNKLRNIPAAVIHMQYLETLDMSNNEIIHIPDDIGCSMESGLRSLSTLNLNSELDERHKHSIIQFMFCLRPSLAIDCTCRFGTGDFADWIRSHAISGVKCQYPAGLKGRDVSTTPAEDFCTSHPGAAGHTLTFSLSLFLTSHLVACSYILIPFLG